MPEPFFSLPLGDGFVALVSEQDRDLVKRSDWHAHETEPGRWYARNNFRERLHRVVMGCRAGDGRMIDHENGDTMDCRRENLRDSDPRHNAQNVRSHRDAVSKYVGVSFDRRSGRWTAALFRNGRHVLAPMPFSTERTAARVRSFVKLLWEACHA